MYQLNALYYSYFTPACFGMTIPIQSLKPITVNWIITLLCIKTLSPFDNLILILTKKCVDFCWFSVIPVPSDLLGEIC